VNWIYLDLYPLKMTNCVDNAIHCGMMFHVVESVPNRNSHPPSSFGILRIDGKIVKRTVANLPLPAAPIDALRRVLNTNPSSPLHAFHSALSPHGHVAAGWYSPRLALEPILSRSPAASVICFAMIIPAFSNPLQLAPPRVPSGTALLAGYRARDDAIDETQSIARRTGCSNAAGIENASPNDISPKAP